jgi:fatty acid desaturase
MAQLPGLAITLGPGWRMDRPTLDPTLLVELHALGYRHWTRLAAFAVLYLAAAAGACSLSAAVPDTAAGLFLGLPFYLVAAASLHGISLFTHEGVHGTLSKRPWLNRTISVLCALPVLQNYAAYRVLHLRHHSHLGQEGDPDHYPNYTRWTWLQFTLYWGRLLVGYPVYITAIPLLGLRHGTWPERGWIVLEFTLLAGLAAMVVLAQVPWTVILHVWLIPMVIINTMVNIRGMSQHTLLEHHDDPVLGTRSILTNPVTRFFMCNENYHLEHHLYPGVPWYNLDRLHQVLRDELRSRGAPFISSYVAFVHEFVVNSLRRCPLGRGTPRG